MSAGNLFLLVILTAGLVPVLEGLDLNKLPDSDSETPSPTTTSSVARPAGGRRISKQQLAKLIELQAKVEMLFERLAICDDEDFDIAKITLPDSWSRESEAMMGLKRVAGKNLIKKKDLDRYKRIMTNCNQISRIFEERRADEDARARRDITGVTYYDAEELERLMDISPLDDLKSRFLKWSARSHEAPEQREQKEASMSPRSPPRSFSAKSSRDKLSIRMRPIDIGRPNQENSPPAFFKFL